MVKRAVPFKQADVTRALKGAAAAAFLVNRVEIDRDGRIVLSSVASTTPLSPLEEWKARKAAADARST